MPNNPLRWRSRRQAGRLAKALGAGSGVTAVIGAVSGSHATIGCGVTSGVLSIGAALLLQERSCNGDVESGTGRGPEQNEEHIELGAVTQATSISRNSSQPSQRHANNMSESEVHETLSSRDGVDLVHGTSTANSNGFPVRDPNMALATTVSCPSDMEQQYPQYTSSAPIEYSPNTPDRQQQRLRTVEDIAITRASRMRREKPNIHQCPYCEFTFTALHNLKSTCLPSPTVIPA
ncbi:hypothetical protein PQX77_005354 [Marasmius sp. AFHP31]|nr:hypothetical protein PQX77_005354 [Marasmius sp. AFHP31]